MFIDFRDVLNLSEKFSLLGCQKGILTNKNREFSLMARHLFRICSKNSRDIEHARWLLARNLSRECLDKSRSIRAPAAIALMMIRFALKKCETTPKRRHMRSFSYIAMRQPLVRLGAVQAAVNFLTTDHSGRNKNECIGLFAHVAFAPCCCCHACTS